MQLIIKHKKEFIVKLNPTDSIGYLKELIERETGVLRSQQKLIIKGIKTFTDHDTLLSLQIPENSKIMVIGTPQDILKKIEDKTEAVAAEELVERIEQQKRQEAEAAKAQAEELRRMELAAQRERERLEAVDRMNREREEMQRRSEVDEEASLSISLPCYSAAFAQKTNLSDNSNTMSLPPSVLAKIVDNKLALPLTFRLTYGDKVTHLGVLDFTAPENTAYLPYTAMSNINLEEGAVVQMDTVKLKKGSFAKLQPIALDWLQIPEEDRKLLLEKVLPNYQSLTIGDKIKVKKDQKQYDFIVLDLQPDIAVDIINCDLVVDVDEPVQGDLYQHLELTLDSPIKISISAGEYMYYYYSVDSSYSNIKISFTVFSGSPKLYVSAQRRFPTKHTFKWIPQTTENNIDGSKTQSIQLNHRDPDFVVGKYFIGIYAEEENCEYELRIIDLSSTENQGQEMELEQFEEDSMEEDLIKVSSDSKIEKDKTNLRISHSTPSSTDTGGITLSTPSHTISYQDDYDYLRKILSQLDPEPSASDPDGITCIVRLPSGTNLTRRFNVNSPLWQLYYFVIIQALPENGNLKIPKEFFFVTDFPKTDYKNLEITFKKANLTQKKCNLRIQPLL